jgi:hypothetical protein
MKTILIPLLVGFALALGWPDAFAGDTPIYKWIDAGGIVHYSDKPPPAPATPDQYLLTLPKLPPVDPQKIAETDAWIASIQALQKRMQADDDKAQRERELALQAPQQQTEPQQDSGVTIQTWPVFTGYARPQFLHRRHRDLRDFDHRFRPKPRSSVPSWPFPYNLDNNSSFPEEWHPQAAGP